MNFIKRLISLTLVTVMLVSALSAIPGFSFTFADGEKAEIDPADSANIAYKKPTRSNDYVGDHTLVVDGSTKTKWTARDYPHYVDIDLLDNYTIDSMKIFSQNKCSFTVYGSVDGVHFTRIYESEGAVPFPSAGLDIEINTKEAYRVIRVNITGIPGGTYRTASLSEVRIHGKKSDKAVTPTRDKLSFTSYEEWLKGYCGFDLSTIKDSDGNYDISKTYTEQDTIDELNGIVSRLLGGGYVSWFEFDVCENPNGKKPSFFKIVYKDGKVKISGASGCDIASGLNWYLKYFCNVSITQETSQVKMPASPVKVGKEVFYETDLSVRYAYNYCTLSYTMPFFGFDDWRRELDWLYLQGVNLILDTTATEALWVYYLQQLGYTADEAKDFVVGYSYKAWWLMGNIENFGGTVSDAWIYDTLEMARINERSMTVMGASPALQTYVGFFPKTFGTIAKQHLLDKGFSDVSASLVYQGNWSGSERPNVLRTDYDGYEYLAKLFYDSQDYIYGKVATYYCGDVCHEGGIIPPGLNREEMAMKILDQLLKADKDGVWILQRWWDNPIREVLDGFGKYRKTNVIVIDLASAQNPSKYQDTQKYGSKEFGGTLWIFSTLDNYGGRPTMHGNLKPICQNIVDAKKNAKYLSGLGITPEGTQNNPLMMDLYWEMVWRDSVPDLKQWVRDYAKRRYGTENKDVQDAWEKIYSVVYSVGTADGTTVNTVIGSLSKFDYEGGYYVATYNNLHLQNAIKLLMSAFDELCDNECYIYDVVDLLQTYLANQAVEYLGIMRNAATSPTTRTRYNVYRDKFLDCMLLINEISAYSENQLVGRWIGRATDWIDDPRSGEYDDYDYDNMVFNAKALISSWFMSGNLIDYANRLYNGLVADYYYPMWAKFLEGVDKKLDQGKDASKMSDTTEAHLAAALTFVTNGKVYTDIASNPKGDETARGLKAIYKSVTANHGALTNANTPMTVIEIKNSETLSRLDSVLYGVKDGESVKNVLAGLTAPSGCTLKVTTIKGKEMAEDDAVSTGCRVVLKNSKGTEVDRIVIGSVSYKSEEDEKKANAIVDEMKELISFTKKLDTSSLKAETAKALNEQKAVAEKVVLSGLNLSLTSLEEKIPAIRSALSAAKAEIGAMDGETPADTSTPEPTETSGAQESENGSSTVIIIIVVAAVVVVAAIVAAVILGKKKKK